MNLQVIQRAPRARGDGPVPCVARYSFASCSPRTRGWSQAFEPIRAPHRVCRRRDLRSCSDLQPPPGMKRPIDRRPSLASITDTQAGPVGDETWPKLPQILRHAMILPGSAHPVDTCSDIVSCSNAECSRCRQLDRRSTPSPGDKVEHPDGYRFRSGRGESSVFVKGPIAGALPEGEHEHPPQTNFSLRRDCGRCCGESGSRNRSQRGSSQAQGGRVGCDHNNPRAGNSEGCSERWRWNMVLRHYYHRFQRRHTEAVLF